MYNFLGAYPPGYQSKFGLVGSTDSIDEHRYADLMFDKLATCVAITWHDLALPSYCEIFIPHIAGALNRVAPDATAFGARDAKYVLNIHGRWEDPDDDDACISWSRALFDAAAPFASDGAYVNFMTEEERERVATAYGPNHERLVEIKRRYDPENVLHMNQNIKP